MSFVRPQATAALMRWREVLISLCIIALGLWWALRSFGVLYWVGVLFVVLGAVLLLAGVQRARFRIGHGGPGVVTVTEGQISYFGPLNGGAIALHDLTQLELAKSETPPLWVLSADGQPDLAIPLTATGADALFDAFATLPNLRTERMLSEMNNDEHHRVVIWSAAALRPSNQRLH